MNQFGIFFLEFLFCCIYLLYLYYYRVVIPPRETDTRVQAKGLFPNALVSRGHDWIWGDQDGIIDNNNNNHCYYNTVHSWRYRKVGSS